MDNDLTKDSKGQPWAKLSELREGHIIKLDDGFTCHKAGLTSLVKDSGGNLAFQCDEGFHSIAGQARRWRASSRHLWTTLEHFILKYKGHPFDDPSPPSHPTS